MTVTALGPAVGGYGQTLGDRADADVIDGSAAGPAAMSITLNVSAPPVAPTPMLATTAVLSRWRDVDSVRFDVGREVTLRIRDLVAVDREHRDQTVVVPRDESPSSRRA